MERAWKPSDQTSAGYEPVSLATLNPLKQVRWESPTAAVDFERVSRPGGVVNIRARSIRV